MPRNRMIKPDFWADEKIGKLSMGARLLYIGIWNFCDDSGVCRATPSYLRSNIFPFDEIISLSNVNDMIKELSNNNRIELIDFENESYLKVIKFLVHQKIDKPSSFRFIKYSPTTQRPLPEYSFPKENVEVEVKENVNNKEKIDEKRNSLFSSPYKKGDSITSESLNSSLSLPLVPKRIELNERRKKIELTLLDGKGKLYGNNTDDYNIVDDLNSIFHFMERENLKLDFIQFAEDSATKLQSGVKDKFGFYYFFNKLRAKYLKEFPTEYFEN